MPRNVKIFLGLCLVYAAWLVWWNIGFIVFPSPQRLQTLARLPAEWRTITDRAEWTAAAMRTLIPLVFFFTFALTAAFGRKNWARWALAIFLIAAEFSFFALVAFFTLRHPDIVAPEFTWSGAWQNWLHRWTTWQSWGWLALKLALIATIFSPNTRSWFRRRVPVA